MKSTLSFMLVIYVLLPIVAFAQVGYYEFEDKETKKTESLELLADGKFIYTKQGEWSNTKVSGTWKFNLNGTVALNSDYQLDSLGVVEDLSDESDTLIYLTLTAPCYKQGPRSISAIILNENPSHGCQMIQEKILMAAEERNRILTSGKQAARDSAMNAYQPLYFECHTKGVDNLQSIRIEFDKKQVEYLPKNAAATDFIINFNLAPEQTYRYFKEEIYMVGKKGLLSRSDKLYKKARK